MRDMNHPHGSSANNNNMNNPIQKSYAKIAFTEDVNGLCIYGDDNSIVGRGGDITVKGDNNQICFKGRVTINGNNNSILQYTGLNLRGDFNYAKCKPKKPPHH